MKPSRSLSRRTASGLGIIVFAGVILGSCTARDKRLRTVPEPALQELASRIGHHGYPRLANQVQACCRGPRTVELFEQLAYWDLVVIDPETLANLPEYFGPSGVLRDRNPSILQLAYFSAADIKPNAAGGDLSLRSAFRSGLDPAWFLRDTQGQTVSLYEIQPGIWTDALNLSSPYNDYLPRWLDDYILSAGVVDGILFDWATTRISWLNRVDPPRQGSIDIDNDGNGDSDQKLDRVWTNGFERMLENSRSLFPAGTLIVGNGGWNTDETYAPLLNGVMIEQFLEGESVDASRFGWSAVMQTGIRRSQNAARGIPRLRHTQQYQHRTGTGRPKNHITKRSRSSEDRRAVH